MSQIAAPGRWSTWVLGACSSELPFGEFAVASAFASRDRSPGPDFTDHFEGAVTADRVSRHLGECPLLSHRYRINPRVRRSRPEDSPKWCFSM